MGYTNRKFNVAEIAIVTQNRPDHANERSQPGDIAAVRQPHHVVGSKETKEYIWLRVEGLEENEYSILISPNYDSNADWRDTESLPAIRFDKRRYCIPLDRLKKIVPIFDVDRAKDSNDIYQPFMNLDEDDFKYLTPQKPLNISGLIFDKLKGEYL